MADAPRFYLDKQMLALSKLPPAPYVPDWIVAQREDINEDKGNTFILKTTLFGWKNLILWSDLTLLNINMSKKSTFA